MRLTTIESLDLVQKVIKRRYILLLPLSSNKWTDRQQEQYKYGSEDADYNEDNPVTLKSDIWAVGRTILALMNLERGRDVKAYRFNSEYELPEYYNDATEAFYPKDLRDLVELCLRDKPAERPDAMKLWEWIQEHVGKVIGRKWLPMKMAYRPRDEMALEMPGEEGAG